VARATYGDERKSSTVMVVWYPRRRVQARPFPRETAMAASCSGSVPYTAMCRLAPGIAGEPAYEDVLTVPFAAQESRPRLPRPPSLRAGVLRGVACFMELEGGREVQCEPVAHTECDCRQRHADLYL